MKNLRLSPTRMNQLAATTPPMKNGFPIKAQTRKKKFGLSDKPSTGLAKQYDNRNFGKMR